MTLSAESPPDAINRNQPVAFTHCAVNVAELLPRNPVNLRQVILRKLRLVAQQSEGQPQRIEQAARFGSKH